MDRCIIHRNDRSRRPSFFNALARPDRQPEPGVVPGRALRVASIDIGGGTTDMAIVHY
ncbi:virulence factor SrfB, partial [Salmonella enterica subsp. enterica serovar Kentucky]|nr:virulence factor SrfB [Salmonella enterica subsp. enterica serovar Kentucky]